jgi:hypothetical protein
MTATDYIEPSVIGTGVDQRRLDTINGLRELCDFLAAHPELPVPEWGVTLQIYGQTKEDLVHAARETGRKWRKLYFGDTFELRANFTGDVSYGLNTKRDQVCERVVTGTEIVDVPAIKARRAKKEEREVVQWVCSPLLAD